MTDYGIKVTLPGKDVTSTDIEDYVLHSGYYSPKTYIVGTCSLGFSGEEDTHTDRDVVSITHNLGYKPYCVFYWNKNNTAYSGDEWLEFQGNPHYCAESITMLVDTSTFKIQYKYNNFGGVGDGNTGISGDTFEMKYYIFIEQGEP